MSVFGNGPRKPRIVRAIEEASGPEAFAPPARRSGTDARLAELQRTLEPKIAAPPPPLSDEARKLISKAEVSQATNVCDALRALAASRIISHDDWATARRKELVEDGERINAWCSDYLAEVTREQEERARRTVRDREIFETNVNMLEKHGMPLPPPKVQEPEAGADVDSPPNPDAPASNIELQNLPGAALGRGQP